MMNSKTRPFAVALVLGAGGLAFSAGALSQTANKVPGSYQVAGLFGESDEEKAERLQMMQHEQAQDSSIRYLRQRNDDLENTVRRLNGQIEEMDHRIDEMTTRIERMQKDFDYRLCKVAAAQLGGADDVPIPCTGGTATIPPGNAGMPPGGVEPGIGKAAAGSPLQLKVPPAGAPALSAPAPAQPASVASPSPNRPKFDAAMKLLAKTQYDEARSAFRSFADTYPRDELAPQAVYWFGDIAYVQKDYPAAARAFAEEIKKYPDSSRAPDSMLKLGQSLIAMGQKQEGCAALAALPTKYPNASEKIAASAAQERKAAHCH